MKLCATCQRPINRGATGNTYSSPRCLACRVAEEMRDFRDPIYEKNQRVLRIAKGKQ